MSDHYQNPASDASDASSVVDTVEHKSHAYDENGDLILIVGPQAEGSFRVCSRTLARTSLVFEKMLFGGFAESRSRYHGGDYWEITLPEDDADSMDIFLNIVHGRPADVPKTLALRALYDLLTVTHKYDATHVVWPWARDWINCKDVMSRKSEPELLCVAWELGHYDLFQEIMERVVVNYRVGEDCQLVFGNSTPNRVRPGADHGPDMDSLNSLEYLKPFDFAETIGSIRTKLISIVLEDPLKTYRLIRHCKGSYNYAPACHGGSERCVLQLLGSVIRMCDDVGIDITDPGVAESYRGSVAELRAAIRRVSPLAAHERCALHIQEHFIGRMLRPGSILKGGQVVPENYRDYLRNQAKKTGLPAPSS